MEQLRYYLTTSFVEGCLITTLLAFLDSTLVIWNFPHSYTHDKFYFQMPIYEILYSLNRLCFGLISLDCCWVELSLRRHYLWRLTYPIPISQVHCCLNPDLSSTRLPKCTLTNLKSRGLTLFKNDISGADFSYSSFTECRMMRISFKRCILNATSFVQTTFEECDFWPPFFSGSFQ